MILASASIFNKWRGSKGQIDQTQPEDVKDNLTTERKTIMAERILSGSLGNELQMSQNQVEGFCRTKDIPYLKGKDGNEYLILDKDLFLTKLGEWAAQGTKKKSITQMEAERRAKDRKKREVKKSRQNAAKAAAETRKKNRELLGKHETTQNHPEEDGEGWSTAEQDNQDFGNLYDDENSTQIPG